MNTATRPAFIANPTAHQAAIFEHVQAGDKNLIVQAVAGSGKTSTIIHAMSLLASDEDAIRAAAPLPPVGCAC